MNAGITAVALAVTGAAAVAAAPPEERRQEMRRNAHAVQVSYRVADCLVDRYRRRAVAVLEQVPGTFEEGQAVMALQRHVQRCYELSGREDSATIIPRAIVRGQLAEALYKCDFGSRRVSRARLPAPEFSSGQRSAPPLIRRSALAGVFASCVAAARPDDAAALLATEPYSSEEQAVIDRMLPHFTPCLPAGEELQINYPLFRGFVAEALYRRAAGAGPGTERRQ